ncbi:hypothetical protein PHYC_03685 [Phycisphaerales bacterium]|nr:hypothetical protein PHYC_03685 [Phycisphaerales bacterium]
MAEPNSPLPRKRMKWEPFALMVAVIALGMYLVWSPLSGLKGPTIREGARSAEVRVGGQRGVVEISPGAQPTFRLLLRNGYESPDLSAEEMQNLLGPEAFQQLAGESPNPLFRLFNITSLGGLLWVLIGLGGQAIFAGRMLVQWVVSEKERASVIPDAFWWMSLIGGVMLFIYFVWRQDFVGVLGQSSGVVVYARNLRLIHKQRRREREAGNFNG